MDRENALQTLHETLPRDASFSLRWCRDTHSVEDFQRRPPVRTGEYKTSEHWTVTVQCHRENRYYLEASKDALLPAAVASALEQFRAWEQMAAQQKPPKLTAPPGRSGGEVDESEAM